MTHLADNTATDHLLIALLVVMLAALGLNASPPEERAACEGSLTQ